MDRHPVAIFQPIPAQANGKLQWRRYPRGCSISQTFDLWHSTNDIRCFYKNVINFTGPRSWYDFLRPGKGAPPIRCIAPGLTPPDYGFPWRCHPQPAAGSPPFPWTVLFAMLTVRPALLLQGQRHSSRGPLSSALAIVTRAPLSCRWLADCCLHLARIALQNSAGFPPLHRSISSTDQKLG